MVKVEGEEREVLGFLKASLDRNQLNGVNTREIADNLDMPIEKVHEAVHKLESKNLAHVDKRNMDKGKVKDEIVHVTAEGIQSIQKEHGTPL